MALIMAYFKKRKEKKRKEKKRKEKKRKEKKRKEKKRKEKKRNELTIIKINCEQSYSVYNN